MLYSLALSGDAPKGLAKLDSAGVPRRAILVCTLAIVLEMVVQFYAPANAYLYMIGASLFGGMLAWGIALLSHIGMRRTLSAEQVAALSMRAPGGAIASALAFSGLAAVRAESRFPPAEHNLGAMYYEGKGVPKDMIAAHVWISLAGRRRIGTQ